MREREGENGSGERGGERDEGIIERKREGERDYLHSKFRYSIRKNKLILLKINLIPTISLTLRCRYLLLFNITKRKS